MRTTLRIDDDLLRELKREAEKQRTSLAALVNRLLRVGIQGGRPRRKARFRQETAAMGKPRFNVDKALAFAAALEDDETLEKMARRK